VKDLLKADDVIVVLANVVTQSDPKSVEPWRASSVCSRRERGTTMTSPATTVGGTSATELGA
jgi:hypothetical protein